MTEYNVFKVSNFHIFVFRNLFSLRYLMVARMYPSPSGICCSRSLLCTARTHVEYPCLVASVMSAIHVLLGRPLPLSPSTLPLFLPPPQLVFSLLLLLLALALLLLSVGHHIIPWCTQSIVSLLLLCQKEDYSLCPLYILHLYYVSFFLLIPLASFKKYDIKESYDIVDIVQVSIYLLASISPY